MKNKKPLEHGFAKTYKNRRCRCDECRKAYNAYELFRAHYHNPKKRYYNKSRPPVKQRNALGLCINCAGSLNGNSYICSDCAKNARLKSKLKKIEENKRKKERLIELAFFKLKGPSSSDAANAI